MALLTPQQVWDDIERLFRALPESQSLMDAVEAKLTSNQGLDDAEAAIALMVMKDKPELRTSLAR